MTKKKKRKNTYKRRKNTYKRRKNTYKRRSSYKKRKSKKRFGKKYKSNKKLIGGGFLADMLAKLRTKETPTPPNVGRPMETEEPVKEPVKEPNTAQNETQRTLSQLSQGQQILQANMKKIADKFDTTMKENTERTTNVNEALAKLNENDVKLRTMMTTAPPISLTPPASLLDMNYTGPSDLDVLTRNVVQKIHDSQTAAGTQHTEPKYAFDFLNKPTQPEEPTGPNQHTEPKYAFDFLNKPTQPEESPFNYMTQVTEGTGLQNMMQKLDDRRLVSDQQSPPVARKQGRRRIGTQ